MVVLIFSNNNVIGGDSQSKSRCRRCKEVRCCARRCNCSSIQMCVSKVSHDKSVLLASMACKIKAISWFGRFFNTKKGWRSNLLDLANLGFLREFEQIDLSCMSFFIIQLNCSSWLTDTLLAPGCDFVVDLRSPQPKSGTGKDKSTTYWEIKTFLDECILTYYMVRLT